MGFFNDLKQKITNKKLNDNNFIKYDKGLEKTRVEFVSKLSDLKEKYKNINEQYFEELENILIQSDFGVNTVIKFVEKLKTRIHNEKITDSNYLTEIIVDELLILYINDDILQYQIKKNNNGPTVLLFVGVNGVGKTTTIGKIGYKLIREGNKVLLIAGDTFRAGAINQLLEWGKRINSEVIYKENSDPSSVIYDGINKAIKDNIDYVLIDTAGRLQNKIDLMNELQKINKVIKSLIPTAPHESLLVLDATTGQNGISQAKSFKDIIDITGIVLAKLDGTAKGGIVIAIKEEVNIPVKFVGLGEKETDLEIFDLEKYIYGLFKDLVK